MTALGQAQQSDPFTAAANYGKIVGGIQAPTTVANRTQLSPLNTIGSLASAGSGVLDTLFGKSKTPGGGIISNAGIMEYLKGLQIPSGGGSGGDAENQAGGFYGGPAPNNPFAGLTDDQLQTLVDAGINPMNYQAPNEEE